MADALVAARVDTTRWDTGAGLVEDVDDLAAGFHSGSWVDPTIGGIGTALDTLAVCVDPLGSLAAWGVAWLMEHVRPLSDALDWLAGDPDQITAYAQTWRNVSAASAGSAEALRSAVDRDLAGWSGPAAEAYRSHAGTHLRALDGMSRAADLLGLIVEGAGMLVATVRALVRDLIAQFVATLAVRLPEWAAAEGITLGLATPFVVAQVSTLVGQWVARIGRYLTGLANSLRRLAPILRRLDDLLTRLGRLTRSRRPRTATDPLVQPAGISFPTGSRFVGSDYTAETAAAYVRIRQTVGDVSRVAEATGIKTEIVDRMKRHLFQTEHDVPIGPNQFERGHFTPDDRIAELWTDAAGGTLDPVRTDEFRRLAAHEYVESRLMEIGMPYRSAHPDAFDEFGDFEVNRNHYGAHDIAPNEYRADPFSHWPAYGREHPGITITPDLSNLDDVVHVILRGRT